jgi:hypothetical protein
MARDVQSQDPSPPLQLQDYVKVSTEYRPNKIIIFTEAVCPAPWIGSSGDVVKSGSVCVKEGIEES